MPRIYLLTNSAWNAYHFRHALWKNLLAAGYEVVAIVPPGKEVTLLEAAGVRVELLPSLAAHGTAPIGELSLLTDLIRLFRRLPAGPVYAFTLKPNFYGGLAARLTGRELIPTWTGQGYLPQFTGWRRQLVYRLLPQAMQSSPLVFFHNDADCADFINQGFIRADQGRVVPGSGIDTDYYAACPWPEATPELRLLFLGRLLVEKGLTELVAVLDELRRRGYRIKCRVAGVRSGNPQAIEHKDLEGWVRAGLLEFVGEVSDVRPHLAWAHCLVLPTYYNEGLPRAILEAMSSGRPVLTTNIPGCRAAVRDGKTGLLVKPRSVPALRRGVLRLLALDTIDLARMGAAGRERVLDHFSESTVLQVYGLPAHACVES